MSSHFQYQKKQTLFKAENVGLIIEGNVILRDINVEIKDIVRTDCIQGQVVSFIGPSGAGKSQFSEIITGLKRPTTGKVLISEPPVEVEAGMVGFVQQNYPLFEYLTVFRNLKVAAQKSDFSKKEQIEKIKFYLDRMNLTIHKDKYPAQLSGGQKQRVAIAQQLLCSKHFLVLDEVFSSLDIISIDKVCKMLQEIASMDELNTIIVITHDITAAVSIADTIWILGKERDGNGNFLPGSKIVKEIDLIERGLAWEPGILLKPEFSETCREIRGIFPTLI